MSPGTESSPRCIDEDCITDLVDAIEGNRKVPLCLSPCSPVRPVVKIFHDLESKFNAHRLRNSPQVSGLLYSEGTPRGAFVLARPGERSDAALYQRRHEPVQGRFPRPRKARLLAGDDFPEMCACWRQAQRSGKC